MQLPFFKKKAKSSGRVGVSVTGDVMAVAHLEMRQGVPHLRQCQTVEIGSAREAGPALERLVKSMGLDGEQCSYVLDYQDYSMHLVEAPNLEPEELRVARFTRFCRQQLSIRPGDSRSAGARRHQH